MKIRYAIPLLLTFIAGGGGFIIGREGAPTVKVRCLNYTSSNGGYVPPTEIVEAINDELKEKVSQIVGGYHAQHHLAVVIPRMSGYDLSIVGPSDSTFWDKSIQTSLRSWVGVRINGLYSEINAKQIEESEQ